MYQLDEIFGIKEESVENHINLYLVSYTEREISIKIRTGVFCAQKPGFLMLSFVYKQ